MAEAATSTAWRERGRAWAITAGSIVLALLAGAVLMVVSSSGTCRYPFDNDIAILLVSASQPPGFCSSISPCHSLAPGGGVDSLLPCSAFSLASSHHSLLR